MNAKTALILGAAATLAACETSTTTTTTAGATGARNTPYVAYGTGRYDYVPADSPLRKVSTEELQARRRKLYGSVPFTETRRNGIPVYKYHDQPLPQQDEIFAIEAELNRRYQAGDRAAELTRPIPGTTHGV